MAAVQLVDVRAHSASSAEDSAAGGNPGVIGASRSKRVRVVCCLVGLVGAAAAAVAGKAASVGQAQGENVDPEYRSISTDPCQGAAVTVCGQVMCKKQLNNADITTPIGAHFTMVYTKPHGQASWMPTNMMKSSECEYAVVKKGHHRGTLVQGVTVQVMGAASSYSSHVLHDGQWYEVSTAALDFDAEPVKVAPEQWLAKQQAGSDVSCADFAHPTATKTMPSWDQKCPKMKETENTQKNADWKEVFLTEVNGKSFTTWVPNSFVTGCKNGAQMKYGWKPAGIPVGATVFILGETPGYTQVVVDVHYRTRWVPTWVLHAPVVTVVGKAGVFLKRVLSSPAIGTRYHRVGPVGTSGVAKSLNCSANVAVTVATSTTPIVLEESKGAVPTTTGGDSPATDKSPEVIVTEMSGTKVPVIDLVTTGEDDMPGDTKKKVSDGFTTTGKDTTTIGGDSKTETEAAGFFSW